MDGRKRAVRARKDLSWTIKCLERAFNSLLVSTEELEQLEPCMIRGFMDRKMAQTEALIQELYERADTVAALDPPHQSPLTFWCGKCEAPIPAEEDGTRPPCKGCIEWEARNRLQI